MSYYFDRDIDEKDMIDKDYIGHQDGYTYTGNGTYTSNTGCSDLYVIKNDDETVSSCREM